MIVMPAVVMAFTGMPGGRCIIESPIWTRSISVESAEEAPPTNDDSLCLFPRSCDPPVVLRGGPRFPIAAILKEFDRTLPWLSSSPRAWLNSWAASPPIMEAKSQTPLSWPLPRPLESRGSLFPFGPASRELWKLGALSSSFPSFSPGFAKATFGSGRAVDDGGVGIVRQTSVSTVFLKRLPS